MKRIILIICLLYFETSSAYYIAVNKKNPIQTISIPLIKEYFLGDKLRWDDNLPVHVADYNSTLQIRKNFTEEVLGVSISRVYKTWIKLSLSGNTIPPKILRSEDEVLDFVASDISSIGYVEKIPDTKNKDVKIIKVEKL
jgi:ABC-type phosphate transport system substrate-binding protein